MWWSVYPTRPYFPCSVTRIAPLHEARGCDKQPCPKGDMKKNCKSMDPEGFEPSTSSVRLMREGQSATSAAYIRWFYPRKIRKNGCKTVQTLIFYHARQLWLQMVANGCKWREEGNAGPTLSCGINPSQF